MASSFRKATRSKAPDVVGTRISVENSQLLVSTGAPAFDSVIGGGLAVGTVLLVEEDPSGSYARLLARLFLAEGVAVGHPLFVASRDRNPAHLVRDLPPAVSSTDTPTPTPTTQSLPGTGEDEKLKIAWRYQHLPTAGTDPHNSPLQFGHHFDLSRTLGPEAELTAKATLWSGQHMPDTQGALPVAYESLLASVRACLTEQGCWVTGEAVGRRTVLRLALFSLGSPCWGVDAHQLPTLLFSLRALMRAACAVCIITFPAHLISRAEAARCRHLADYCVQPAPATWREGKVAPLLSGMDGVFRVLRLPAINCLAPHQPDSLDLGFKVRRKKFTIEKLQLPPELTDSVEREQDDVVAPSAGSMGCGAAASRNLDF